MGAEEENLHALGRALGFDDADAIVDRVRRVYQSVDGAVAKPKLDVPCRAGCSRCCYESVFLSAPEFLVVAQSVLSWRFERRQALLEAMCKLAAEFSDEIELLQELPAGPERDEVAERIKFRCPLLDENEMCSVYDARELNGRTFGGSWDGQRNHPYGCELTHAQFRTLRILGPRSDLADARACRRWLVEAVPQTEIVHVYPYWFSKYQAHFGPSDRLG